MVMDKDTCMLAKQKANNLQLFTSWNKLNKARLHTAIIPSYYKVEQLLMHLSILIYVCVSHQSLWAM